MGMLDDTFDLSDYEKPPVKMNKTEGICMGYGKAVPAYCAKYGCGFSVGWCFKAGQVKLKSKSVGRHLKVETRSIPMDRSKASWTKIDR